MSGNMEKWFKFYSADYLLDGKIRSLTASERSCLITLFCLADTSDIPGVIKNINEFDLLVMSGVDNQHETWNETEGVIDKLAKYGILKRLDNGDVEILNFRKRQGSALTSYERVKRHREKKRNETLVTNDNFNDNPRIEENRIEENRIDKRERDATPGEQARNFFENPEPQIQALLAKGLPENPVRSEITKFISYWTELNKSGTKQRWAGEPTFEVGRRLATWFSRIKEFNKSKTAIIR